MKRRGVTLIEMLVSFSVVLVLCIFVLNIFPGSLIALRYSATRFDAQRAAEIVLDQARWAGFAAYPPGTTTALPAIVINGMTYQPTLQVTAVPGNDPTLLKAMQVTVQWSDQGGTRTLVQSCWMSRAS